MYTKRVLCKYFMHGACFKGDACEFSHNWSDQASNVCTFYQKGLCSYGSRCRYDHIKPSQPQRRAADISSSSGTSTDLKKPMSQFGDSSGTGYLGYSAMDPTAPPWSKPCDKEATSVVGESHQYEVGIFDDPAEAPICAFAAAGECPRGESCVHLHGDLCPTCGKRCLHPFRPSERKEHAVQCERNQRRLEALRRSQEIECSICLERVLSKPTVAERKFGLLSGCNHAFCVPCIRGWRSSVQPPSIDVDAVLRTCPVCRVLSYYVIPSVIWYFSPEEKQEIVNGYKSKLSSLDCKHFDFGNGHCPFGTSCFYKHGYRDGRVEEVRLRHLSAADGDTVIAKEVRLSEFLNRMDLRG